MTNRDELDEMLYGGKVTIVYRNSEEEDWPAEIINYNDIGVIAEAFDYRCLIPWSSIREIRKITSNADKKIPEDQP